MLPTNPNVYTTKTYIGSFNFLNTKYTDTFIGKTQAERKKPRIFIPQNQRNKVLDLKEVEGMIELKSSEVFNVFFGIANKIIKFEISKPMEKKREASIFGRLEIVDKIFLLEGFKGKLLRPAVFDKFKKTEFGNINLMRKILPLTDEDLESVTISSKAKNSVCDEVMMDCEQCIYQDLENLLEQCEEKKMIWTSIYKFIFLVLRLMRYHQVFMKLMILLTL